MLAWNGFGEGFNLFIQPIALAALFGGTLVGIIIGAIPGIAAATGMALLLPVLFFWRPDLALILFSALWMADQYGGSISSIYIGVPGGAGAIMTTMDGYPMAQQGKGLVATGLALTGSAVGGLTGALAFLLLAPPLATLAIRFGSAEYFLVAVLGLTLIASAVGGNLLKSLVSAGIGLLAGLVGIDIITGYPRFSFGVNYLLDPLDIRVVILGIFAVALLFEAAAENSQVLQVSQNRGTIFDGMRLAFKYRITIIRSAIIGTVVGVLPGAGISVAAPLAYQQTVNMSKHPETFGKGDPEGVLAPETANNAVQGGALVPTLTLGIPGSVTSAVFMAGLLMYGLRPGPKIFIDQGPLVWEIWWAMIGSVVLFVILGPLLNQLFVKSVQTPFKYMLPFLMVLVVGGALSTTNSVPDIIATLGFGVLGYFLQRHQYRIVPFILGFILGPMAEENFFRSLLISDGSFGIFLSGWINPVLIALTLFGLIWYFWGQWKTKRKAAIRST